MSDKVEQIVKRFADRVGMPPDERLLWMPAAIECEKAIIDEAVRQAVEKCKCFRNIDGSGHVDTVPSSSDLCECGHPFSRHALDGAGSCDCFCCCDKFRPAPHPHVDVNSLSEQRRKHIMSGKDLDTFVPQPVQPPATETRITELEETVEVLGSERDIARQRVDSLKAELADSYNYDKEEKTQLEADNAELRKLLDPAVVKAARTLEEQETLTKRCGDLLKENAKLREQVKTREREASILRDEKVLFGRQLGKALEQVKVLRDMRLPLMLTRWAKWSDSVTAKKMVKIADRIESALRATEGEDERKD